MSKVDFSELYETAEKVKAQTKEKIEQVNLKIWELQKKKYESILNQLQPIREGLINLSKLKGYVKIKVSDKHFSITMEANNCPDRCEISYSDLKKTHAGNFELDYFNSSILCANDGLLAAWDDKNYFEQLKEELVKAYNTYLESYAQEGKKVDEQLSFWKEVNNNGVQ